MLKFYRNRRILITGHSGFKGSWLFRWLELIGADVSGVSLTPSTIPNHFDLLYNQKELKSYWSNICDLDALTEIFENQRPEIIFHLAAQPSVIESYRSPLSTLETNVMGTANVLTAARFSKSVKTVVIITTDKCYENKEWIHPYRETDPLGGYDLYSASKACSELVTSAFRKSFFSAKDTVISIATARAGNVIGGGDWTRDRLIVDYIQASFSGEEFILRNPYSTRPWQHVLDPLWGYLLLAKAIFEDKSLEGAYNFGPDHTSNVTTKSLLNYFPRELAPKIIEKKPDFGSYHEANLLMVDSSKARNVLGYKPFLDLEAAVKFTSDWYERYYTDREILTEVQIQQYMSMVTT